MPKKSLGYNYLNGSSLPAETVKQAVIFADLKGNITSLNKYAEELLDISVVDSIGKNIDVVIPTIFFKRRFKKIKTSLKKGESWSGEFTLKRRTGDKFTASIIDFPILDNKNQVVGFTKIIEDISKRKKDWEKSEFLIDASRELSRTLDYKVTLNTLSELIVPNLADWFSVDIIDDQGNIELLVMAHKDVKKIPLGRRLRQRYVVSDQANSGLKYVIKTGKSVLYPEITEEALDKSDADNAYIKLVKKLGFRSAMIVPLVSRGKVFGAITFVTTKESARLYDSSDLTFAENFARHAALSLDNSFLYLTAQKEIKERKETEESLIQLTETLELSQQAGNIGSFEWDLDTNELMWTSKLETLYGLEPGDFGGTYKEWINLIHPEDRTYVEKELKNSIRHKSQLNIQFRIVYPNEEIRWMSVKAEIFTSGIRTVERMLGVQMDITHRKLLEIDLQRSKDQMNIIFQNVADGITVQDSGGKLIYANNAAAIASGYENGLEMVKEYSAKILKKNKKKLDKYEMRDEEGKPFSVEALPGRRALKGEKNPEAIINYFDKRTKRSKWSLVKARPIFDDNNRVQFAVSIISDITEQKDVERRKDEFLSMASHELKTPLTSMKAFVQVLQRRLEKYSDLEGRTFLNKVDDQINKLTKLIGDLLDISKIQAGKIEFRKDYFKLDELIDDMIDGVQRTVRTHKILKSGTTNAEIYGDRDRIGQVIINLLTNAIKYSPEANKVFVRLGTLENKAFIEIQDFGIGIPKEYHEKIFSRYFQVGDAKSQSGAGLGIGLYIASQIAKFHGGSIKLTSERGKGSIFRVVLPVIRKIKK